MFLKVIACEIAVRELPFAASRSKNLIDLEFLSQGHHDNPTIGRQEIQARIDAVPVGKYDGILLGYALCSSILTGLKTSHTRVVIPRAHDCITLFLGSKDRYQQRFTQQPGTYYFTSGWLECATRRGADPNSWNSTASPANTVSKTQAAYQKWVEKYGEDQAKYLMEEMTRWSENYTRGCLIHYDFLECLKLPDRVRHICSEKGWVYDQISGDLSLFEKMLNAEWPDKEFLVVNPGQTVVPSFDESIIATKG